LLEVEEMVADSLDVVIGGRLGLLKIGVAEDAGKRLRELQVGSPVELTLADTRPYGERADAVAVCEELYRCFAPRRARGGWYRLTLEEARHGFGRPATVEAPRRARAAEAARERRVAPGQRKRLGKRTEKQLAYERRRRQERTRTQKRAARLLGGGMTQERAAAAVGVTSRTLRNWKAAPAFRRELERVQQRRQHGPAPAPARSRTAKGPVRRGADDRNRDRAPPSPAQQQPTAEAEGEEKLPSGFRWVGGVPLWGDSDGWPRTGEEHGQRHAHYTARRDLSQADRYDYNTVVRLGRQTAAEQRAVRQEQKRSRELARAKRIASRDP
jgi:hypothetical protein